MTIPKRLVVSPHVYEVRLDDALLKGAELWGQCDNEELILRYRVNGISQSQIRETILHEVLHAVFYNAGIKFPSDDDEENIVNRIAPRLLGVIRDNPRFSLWLQEAR